MPRTVRDLRRRVLVGALLMALGAALALAAGHLALEYQTAGRGDPAPAGGPS